MGDWWSWVYAFNGLIDHELVSLECVPTGVEVACTIQETDAIYQLAGVEPEPYTAILTIEDELVVGWEEPEFVFNETLHRALQVARQFGDAQLRHALT